MNYQFKLWEELAWAAGLAILAVLVTSLAGDPPSNWSDWIQVTLWSIARSVVGAALNVIRMARGATAGE